MIGFNTLKDPLPPLTPKEQAVANLLAVIQEQLKPVLSQFVMNTPEPSGELSVKLRIYKGFAEVQTVSWETEQFQINVDLTRENC